MRQHFLTPTLSRSIAMLVCCWLLMAPVAPFGFANARRTSTTHRSQDSAPAPRAGAPEGTLPNLDEVKTRQLPQPRAPQPVVSALRSRRNPLAPRTRRVGDPLPLPSPVPSPSIPPRPSPSIPPPPSPLPSPSIPPLPSGSVSPNSLRPRTLPFGEMNSNNELLNYLLAWNGTKPHSEEGLYLNTDFSNSNPTSRTAVAENEASSFDFFFVPMPQAVVSKIVFTSNRDGNRQIYSMNTDGSGLTRLTNNSYNDDHPRWSPNGTKILFQSDRDSTPPDPENPLPAKQDIYVMNADGSGQARLTTDAADDCNAEWSPDGSKIVFQSLRNGSYYQVYSMNADGSGQMSLSNSTAADTQPSWSPNGAKIAFASERDHLGVPAIYVMNANGSNQTRLTFTSEPFRDEEPVWSRDALKIAFVSTRDSVVETWQETDDDGNLLTRSRVNTNKEIYLMNADGSNQVRLTNTLENDESPAWSPDGNKIVFHSSRERDAFDPTAQLWSMNPDGSNQVLITSDEFGESSPSWGNTAGNQNPIASSGGSYSGVVAQNVPFSGAGSFDPDGTIVSYTWTFGDGGGGSGVAPTHSYASTGIYNVTLTVTDNLGAQASATTTANITTAGSEQYLANFNFSALARQPYTNESSYWNDILRAAYPNGQTSMVLAVRELGKTLFESSDYAARNRNNHWYVYDLYKTYLMREPDAPGWAYWESVVPANGRENVRHAFDECGEFAGIVATLTPSGTPSSGVSSLASARVDPFNQPGNGLTSRDAEWSVPLLSLPGRAGLDLGLSLSYSSMVWTHSGPYIYFDEDSGWPSPGFRLGFPIVQAKSFDAQAGRNVYLLISGGNRVSLRQVGTSNVYEAADSSYLQLIDNGGSLLLRTTDGTQLNFLIFNNEWHCTQIKDRNGNYISVNYDWLGHITTIIDTLARTITFNYDGNANLISITQSWAGQTPPHTWASFGWTTKTIQPSFSGVMVVGANPATVPVISQVGLDDGSHYTFEYNAAGQVNPIRSYRSDNFERAYTAYDYDSPADDCPLLIDTHTWAENWTGINGLPQEVATNYGAPGDGSHTVTTPDGTLYKEFYGTGWQRGLTTQTEVWAGGVRQKWTTVNWTQDNTAVNYQTNPRVTETNIYDAGGNRRRTTIDYGIYAQYGLPYAVREFATDGVTEIRDSFTDYNLSQPYLDRHIIGLVSEVHLTSAPQWQGKMTYTYDDPARLQSQATTATQHDQSYSASFTTRGNVTGVLRWDVTDITNASKALTTQMSYDAAGSVLTSSDPLAHQTSLAYADSFSDNSNHNTFAYPTTATDADGFSTTVQYNFDFGAKTRAQGPPPANQPQGSIQTFAYDNAARVERITTVNNGAYTRYLYGPNYVQSFSTVNTVADEAYRVQVFDGVGRIRAVGGNNPGSVGGYSGKFTIYDVMGRLAHWTNPAEINGDWAPVGDDNSGWILSFQTYDWKGRPLVTTNQDGTTKEASYSGCGCAGGEVVTLTDEVGRRQKTYSDVLGRAVKTQVLNSDGSIYSSATNTYNVRDQITFANAYQGEASTDGSCPSGTCQQTAFAYDGYGRLKTKHVPEQDTDSVTNWDYNPDNTVQKITDGRGASQTFSYNGRHQIREVSYGIPAGSNIPVPAPMSVDYDASGNRLSISDDSGSCAYTYDQLSRMTSETHTFNGLSGSYPLTYDYNLAGQLTKITDPTNVTIDYNYDLAGRVGSITAENNLYGGVSQYASELTYRAWGAIKGMTYGNNSILSSVYDGRMRLSQFEIDGSGGATTLMRSQFTYLADGNLKYAQSMIDERFDRAYSYDQVAMLKEAYSGSEARDYVNGTNSGAPTGPYLQTYQHDVFGNMTQRDNRFWSQTDTFIASYTNNRRAGFNYDADGRLSQDTDLQYYYDAAGKIRFTFNAATNKWLTLIHDGNGQQVKRIETQGASNTNTYYLRSTVLGGNIVTELNQSSQKQKGYVFAGDQLLALQQNNSVTWQHEDPLTGSHRESTQSGQIASMNEPDPMGVDVGFADPYINCCVEPPLNQPMPMLLAGFDIPDGRCTLDGIAIGCALAGQLMESGAVAVEFLIHDQSGWRVEQSPIISFGVGIFGFDTPTIRRDSEGPYLGWQPFVFSLGSQDTRWQSVDPDGIRDALDRMLKAGDCGKFVEDLINRLGAKTKQPFVSDYALDLFDAVRSQGGFVRGGLADENHVGATVSGHIYNGKKRGDATIHIGSNFELGSSDPQTRADVVNKLDAFQVLHELIHHAGRNNYYTDRQVAEVLSKMTGTPGLPNRKDYKSDKDFLGANSTYFSQVLAQKCPVLSTVGK